MTEGRFPCAHADNDKETELTHSSMSPYERDILQLTIRLFVEAKKRWGLTMAECADLFDRYDLDSFIEDCYEAFHVQGDETNLDEIEEYLAAKGHVA